MLGPKLEQDPNAIAGMPIQLSDPPFELGEQGSISRLLCALQLTIDIHVLFVGR